MKILYVTTISNTLNAFLIPHIKLLLDEGHEVSVACNIEQDLKSFFYDSEIKVYNIPFSRNPLSRENVNAFHGLRKVIEENEYDIVHTHTPIASAITRLVCKKRRTKVFYTAHGFHFYKGAPLSNWLFYYPIEKCLSMYTDTLITINTEDFNIAKEKLFAQNNHLIHGVGLNTKEIVDKEVDYLNKRIELGIDKTQFVLASIGELNKNKNHSFVIDALKNYSDVDFKYLICGTGNLRKELEKQIKDNNLEDKIELLGYRQDAIDILKICDCFIFPSIREGLPVSIMEAMSCGIPIFASDIRGNHDLVKNSVNGLLFDPTKKEELTKILGLFFSRRLPIDMYVEKSREVVNDYDIEKVKKEIAQLYQ